MMSLREYPSSLKSFFLLDLVPPMGMQVRRRRSLSTMMRDAIRGIGSLLLTRHWWTRTSFKGLTSCAM